jgi:hypothetical protein
MQRREHELEAVTEDREGMSGKADNRAESE